MTSQTAPTPTTEHPGLRLVPSFTPIGHYAHPDDPSDRTALCGCTILGIPTFGHFGLCKDCERLAEEQKSG